MFGFFREMIGPLINAGAIILCGIWALITPRQPSAKVQNALKGLLGVLTIIVGLRLTVINLSGGWGHVLKQGCIILLSLTVGRLLGQLLHLQKASNRLGQYAKDQLESALPRHQRRFTDGFITGSLLFCLAPLTFLGAVQDGLAGFWQTLAVKAVMDGLTVVAFVSTFGWSVIMAALPVLALQGTISLGARLVAQHIDPGMINAIDATSGMVVFSVGLVILELKKISLTDYLPALLVAPILVWVWPSW